MIAPLPTQSFLGQVLPVQATEGPGTSAADRAETMTSAEIKAPAVAAATDQNGGARTGTENSAIPKGALSRQRVADESAGAKFESLRRDMEERIASAVEEAVLNRMMLSENSEGPPPEEKSAEMKSEEVRRMIMELTKQAQEGYSSGAQSLEPYEGPEMSRAA